jgi:hypothetical protein
LVRSFRARDMNSFYPGASRTQPQAMMGRRYAAMLAAVCRVRPGLTPFRFRPVEDSGVVVFGMLRRCDRRGSGRTRAFTAGAVERGRQRIIGGGGGNRTRVRKWIYISFYVRSPSFEIRRLETRRARFPRSLGGVDTLRWSPRRAPTSRPAVVASAR